MSLIAKSNVLIVFLSQNYDVNEENMIIQHISRKLNCLTKLLVTQLYTSEVNTGLKTAQSFSKGIVKYSCLISSGLEKNIYVNKWANYKYYKDK